MSLHRSDLIALARSSDSVRVYDYGDSRQFYLPAKERARMALRRRPLQRVITKRGCARWRAGQRGPTFNNSTIEQLIAEGFAVRVGDFVEVKGIVR